MEEVLHSPDLLLLVLQMLPLKHCAAAATCSLWRDVWNEYVLNGLFPALPVPEMLDLGGGNYAGMVYGLCSFGNDNRLCVVTEDAVFVLDEQLNQLQCIARPQNQGPFASTSGAIAMAGNVNGVYVSSRSIFPTSRALQHIDIMDNFKILTEYDLHDAYEHEDVDITDIACHPNGRALFAVVQEYGDSEVLVFAALDLTNEMFRFGRDIFGAEKALGIAVGPDELYVAHLGHTSNSHIRAFTFAGELLRVFDFDCRLDGMCFAEDRLYFTGCESNRIFVYSLEGELLRDCGHDWCCGAEPEAHPRSLEHVCQLGEQLIVSSNHPVLGSLVTFEGL